MLLKVGVHLQLSEARRLYIIRKRIQEKSYP